MKIALFGYGEMGCTGLEFFLGEQEEIVAVVTHRDHPNEKRWYRSLAELAGTHNIEVFFGEDFDAAGLEGLMKRLEPEMILSFYYRRLLPMEVLRVAPKAALNLHGSLLPRLRGRAPTNWALVECEERTGVTLHHMVKEPDAGDIVAQRGFAIEPRETALEVFNRQVEEAKVLLRVVWPKIRSGTVPRVPQDHSRATYGRRRTAEDGRIDWSQPTRRIDGLVRAVTDPWPGAFTFLDGKKLMVCAGSPAPGRGTPGAVVAPGVVATGDGAYRIERATIEGADALPLLRAGRRLS